MIMITIYSYYESSPVYYIDSWINVVDRNIKLGSFRTEGISILSVFKQVLSGDSFHRTAGSRL